MALAFRFITFLSDYGLEDEFVGVCRGVIKRFAPEVEILDVAHGIPPQDIHAGATVLAQAVRYMPAAVHLAVVDPGVGTNRRQVVLGTKNGPPLVGPDNGLLCPAADALGGATQAFSIENRDLFLQAPSRTFHGRDIFAPVAARLALGMAPEEVGPRIDVESLVKLKQRQADVHDDHVHARIEQIDHFGNLQLNVVRQDLHAVGVLPGDELEARIGGRVFAPIYGNAFSEVQPGRLIVLEDSYRWMTLAANQGSASMLVEARRGDAVVLARKQKAAT
ncbi:MAG: S-adenosyl-l-methionine hydroxide adenosyltransferase family protein [Actinomycetota bacterium]